MRIEAFFSYCASKVFIEIENEYHHIDNLISVAGEQSIHYQYRKINVAYCRM